MRLAAACALGAWAVVIVLVLLATPTWSVSAALVLAAAMTALAAAHWFVFLRLAAKALRDAGPGEAAEPVSWGRRDFFTAVAKVAAVAMFGQGLLLTARAGAQQTQPSTPCAGTHQVAQNITVNTCVNKNNKDPEKVAENTTRGDAKKRAQDIADTTCKALDNCGSRECKRAGQGYTLEFVSCVPNAAVKCQKNHNGYTCTWRVTSVTCRCA
jgi:hypothetical protein